MDSVIINGVEYVRREDLDLVSVDGKPYVIVRCSAAGVHAGYLMSEGNGDGNNIELTHSRRLWRWHGRTLSGLALEGTDDVSKCKFGDTLPRITLFGVCEIIRCTEAARLSLDSVPKWVNG
jgi:hypothetical protein